MALIYKHFVSCVTIRKGRKAFCCRLISNSDLADAYKAVPFLGMIN